MSTAPVSAGLTAAIETTLRSILDEGVNPASLARIERFARAQREALIAVQGPEAALDNRLATIGALNFGNTDSASPFSALAPAPPSETYGANALRSIAGPLQDALQRLGKPPPPRTETVASLVDAMAIAHTAGMTDVVDELRVKLREHMTTPTVDEEAGENRKALVAVAAAGMTEAVEMIDATPGDGSTEAAFVAGLARGLSGLGTEAP